MEQTANTPGCRSSAAHTAGLLSAAEGARPSDRLSDHLIEDAVEGAASRHPTRADGWTPDRIRTFLDVLSQCGVVEDAARACGMSKQGAYNFRNSARGRAFDVAWRAAQLLARNRIADDVMSRAIHGCREVIIRNGEVWGERHRFDNRLTMAVLKRLDDLASPHVGQIDQAPRRVAHEFEALVDAVCAGGEEGMAFIQSRCALRYEDFEEQRILERNHEHACSRAAADDEADEWEPETSSTLIDRVADFLGVPLAPDVSHEAAIEQVREAVFGITGASPEKDGWEPETSSTSGEVEGVLAAPGSLESLPVDGGWRPEISSTSAEKPAAQVARLIAEVMAARAPTWDSAVVLGMTPYEEGPEGAIAAVEDGPARRGRGRRRAGGKSEVRGSGEAVGAGA